ncbi:hypothetical protein TNIN_454781 [Trichonephila inaurata madagascariensis]|uniref:Uncharacterized protein n=1 Tax=Trichonephila inaurata madagascariensis TaxID=2747483 RepID=A0A8X6MHY4_9ARAC|nr:hypothetical protein TNIN_454781 [Trichonephila inaurata madagascariensis]
MFKGTIFSENQVVDCGLRPDLVAETDGNIVITDVRIPFKNRRGAFAEARQRKITKYQPIVDFFNRAHNRNAIIILIVVGSLGSWNPGERRVLAQNRYQILSQRPAKTLSF